MRLIRMFLAASILFAVSFANALDIFVRGVVEDSVGVPVDSAKISLKKNGSFAYSDALGMWELKVSETTALPENSESAAHSFQNGWLNVIVPVGLCDFKATAFDMNGRVLYQLSRTLSAGVHAFDLNGNLKNHSRYLLQVQLGNRKTVFLAKAGFALSDTLVVEKEGFERHESPIGDSPSSITIVLDRLPEPVLKKRGS